MRCLICQTLIPEEAWQCPRCGDHLGQWVEMNSLAEQFLSEGAFHASQGSSLKAALSLAKASVLNPGDPVTFNALGKVLAQSGEYAEALYYLNKSISVAESQGVPVLDETRTALAKVQELQTECPPAATESPLLGLIAFQRDGEGCPSDAESGALSAANTEADCALDAARQNAAELWNTVIELEDDWEPRHETLSRILKWPAPTGDAYRGPWHYLRGLAALADGDSSSAERAFQDCAATDSTHRNADLYLLHLGLQSDRLEQTIGSMREQGRSTADLSETLRILVNIQESRHNQEGAMRLLEFTRTLTLEIDSQSGAVDQPLPIGSDQSSS